MLINYSVLLIVAACSAVLTFYVNEHLKQGPVRSSALLSLLVAGFFYLFPHSLNPFLVKNVPVIFIGASFIGMVSAKLISNYFKIVLAAVLFCCLYLNTSHFFYGYGGALGTAASISLLVILSIPFFKIKGKLTNGLDQLKKMVYDDPAD